MATLSAHLRLFEARYPDRQVAAEGRGQLVDLMTLVANVREPDLQVVSLRAEEPVVHARYTITGELTEPFGLLGAGDRVVAEVNGTYRYDNYGLLIEQWIQLTYRGLGPALLPVGAASAP
jgi:hypothetical protein